MGIFNDFNKKEKPVFTGLRFGFGSGGGSTAVAEEAAGSAGVTATGGIISDYVDSGTYYRAHIFNTAGTFAVSAVSPDPTNNQVDILLIGGGGGGGSQHGGGGGAGGWVTKTGYVVTASPGDYYVAVGAGGRGGAGEGGSADRNRGNSGGDTEFYKSGASYPGSDRFRALGGGGGAQYVNGNNPGGGGNPGGSGGGGSTNGGSNESAPSIGAGPGTQPGANPGTPNITQYGNNGGSGGVSDAGGGGGGGAGAAGENRSDHPGRTNGGAGRANTYAYGPTNPITYAAGGGSGGNVQNGGNGGAPNAGHGGRNPSAGGLGPLHPVVPAALAGPVPDTQGTNAEAGFGHGGGGSGSGEARGGNGGTGCVVVRYVINAFSDTAAATGGAISFYGGKTIHVFTGAGSFVTPGSFNKTVEYFIVGGGGSGGQSSGGGAGAGGIKNGTTPINGAVNYPVTIGNGGEGVLFGSDGPSNSGEGVPGNTTAWGPLNIGGGGGGGSSPPPRAGLPGQPNGGSGGGGGADGGGSHSGGLTPGTQHPGSYPFPAATASPGGGWGTTGGTHGPYPGSAGGGGAGQAGSGPPAVGGYGAQAPVTFINPESLVGDPAPGAPSSGGYWFAGGGNGWSNVSPVPTSRPYGGGGYYVSPPFGQNVGKDGMANTGGGGSGDPGGGMGGPGIVMIAYPT